MDTIWWNKIPNAVQFIQKVIGTVNEGNSVILQLTDSIPWYETMRSIIENDLTKQNSYGVLKGFDSPETDPGEFLFQAYCKQEIRATYRPSKTYARFLAEHEELGLHYDNLWICTNSDQQLNAWLDFVDDYCSNIPKNSPSCRFIIETRKQESLSDKKRIKVISYNESIEHYDNVLFSMMAASSVHGSETLKRYLAEVVSLLFPNDVEFSSECVRHGMLFLTDPKSIINKINELERRSNGDTFEFTLTDEELNERIWEAQIKVLFPIIERVRNEIVRKYQSQIERVLPIQTSYGEITLAEDVELGHLNAMAANGAIHLPQEDYNKVAKFKEARNNLAHFSIMSQKEVDFIILEGTK